MLAHARRIQGALDHPAIPPAHDLAHDAEGRPYMVMKRLVGTTLSEVFAKLRERDAAAITAFPRQRLLRAFVDVCLALELAHTRGVVHRDLKPSNIMLGEFGEVFVLDWGVAKVRGDADSDLRSSSSDLGASDDATQAGVVIGTPGFISPEQRAGRELDGRSDVFALGCLLHEILTGVRIAIDEPLPVRVEETGVDVPPELADLVRAATEPDVEKRPTARALGEDLQRFLDGDRDVELRRSLADKYIARAKVFVTETAIVLDVGVRLTPFSVHLGLLMYAIGLVLAATVITRNLGRGDDEAQHQLRLYAWKPRQLLRPAA